MGRKKIIEKPGRKRITTKVAVILQASAAFKKCYEEAPIESLYPVNKVSAALQALPEDLIKDIAYLFRRARWSTQRY